MQRYTILLTWPNFFFTTGFNRTLRRPKKVFFVKPQPLHPDPLSSAPSEPKNTQNIENQHKYHTKQLQTTDYQCPTPYQLPTNSLPTPPQLPPNSYHSRR